MRRIRFNPPSTVERLTEKGYPVFDVPLSKPVPDAHSTAVIAGIGPDGDKAEEFTDFLDDNASLESSPDYSSHWKTVACTGMLLALLAATGSYVLANPTFSNSGRATLAKAEAALHSGDLPTAVHLAESVSPKSRVYQKAQVAIARWPVDWRQAEEILNSMETALAKKRWRDVLTYARQMPDIAIWQRRLHPIARSALDYLNTEAQQQLETAATLARKQAFSKAIAQLQQIPVEARVYGLAQRHIADYAAKREIQAQYLLQRADYQAAVNNFAKAIDYLQQIPSNSSVSDLAQQKILEYTEEYQIETPDQAQAPRLLPAPGEPGELSQFEALFSNRRVITSSNTMAEPVETPRLLPAPGEPGELSQFEALFSNQPLLKSITPAREPKVDIHIPMTDSINPGDQLQEITPRFIPRAL